MRVLPICAAAMMLSGCATTAAKPALAKASCDAAKAEAFAGRDGTAVAEAARAAAKAKTVRVYGPNEAVTMDFRPDRLNLETDAAGKVVKARCG